jgi:putative addiction module component (TIGR02574 family)
MQADLDSLRLLPLAEKLRVVEVLWHDITTSSEDFPIPAWLRAEVEHRLAEHQNNPTATISREELWQQVDARRG